MRNKIALFVFVFVFKEGNKDVVTYLIWEPMRILPFLIKKKDMLINNIPVWTFVSFHATMLFRM